MPVKSGWGGGKLAVKKRWWFSTFSLAGTIFLSHTNNNNKKHKTHLLSLLKSPSCPSMLGVCVQSGAVLRSRSHSLSLTHFLVTFSCAATVPGGGWKSSKRKATCWRNLEFLSQIKSVACSIRSQTGARIRSSFFGWSGCGCMSRRVFFKGGREGWLGTRGIYVWKLSVLVLAKGIVKISICCYHRDRGFVNFGHAVNANKDKCSSTLQPPLRVGKCLCGVWCVLPTFRSCCSVPREESATSLLYMVSDCNARVIGPILNKFWTERIKCLNRSKIGVSTLKNCSVTLWKLENVVMCTGGKLFSCIVDTHYYSANRSTERIYPQSRGGGVCVEFTLQK